MFSWNVHTWNSSCFGNMAAYVLIWIMENNHLSIEWFAFEHILIQDLSMDHMFPLGQFTFSICFHPKFKRKICSHKKLNFLRSEIFVTTVRHEVRVSLQRGKHLSLVKVIYWEVIGRWAFIFISILQCLYCTWQYRYRAVL